MAAALTTALVVAALGLPSAAVSAPAPAVPRVIITAGAMAVDIQAGIVTATGQVSIADGTTTATAGRATFYQAQRRAVLAEGPRVASPDGVLQATEIVVQYTIRAITRVTARGEASLQTKVGHLSAPQIVITAADDTVIAGPGVTFSVPPDIRATGRRLTYQRARAVAVLDGEARVSNREGFVSGDRIEVEERRQYARVGGPVWGRFRDIEVRSHTAEIFGAEKKAVFTGEVTVRQPGRQMTTEKATVWYETRRVVAEGQTRVRLEGEP